MPDWYHISDTDERNAHEYVVATMEYLQARQSECGLGITVFDTKE